MAPFKKLLKTLFLFIGLLFGAVGTYAVTVLYQIAWWEGLLILFGIVGVICGIFILKKVIVRRREKSFVRQILEQDEAAIEGRPIHERQKLRDLQIRWKEAIDSLRSSNLKERGDPLYVLPWYLIIG